MDNQKPDIKKDSKSFALRIIKLYQYLTETAEKREYIMSKQVLRSGTSVGANIYEASRAQSRADFLSKMSIASKEASETQYWLELLNESGYIPDVQISGIMEDCLEINRKLVSIVKTTGDSLKK